MRRRRRTFADVLFCRSPRWHGIAEGCEVYVLSGHAPGEESEEDELSPRSTEAGEDDSWIPWGIGAWLFPFEAFGSKPKGGICTQCLLAVLRSRGEPQAEPAGGRRSVVSPKDLLKGMHSVATAAGCPSALLTLRASCRLPAAVARVFPSASELRRPPRALLVGICYVDSSEWKLHGAWNDVSDLRGWLSSELQWPRQSVRVLTDRAQDTKSWPTRANILRHLEWLLEDERPDDDSESEQACRLLHFCGHGGEDELYPVDWESAGAISGGQLAELLAAGLHRGTTFTCILDCCKSSSLLRSLEYKLQVPRSQKLSCCT